MNKIKFKKTYIIFPLILSFLLILYFLVFFSNKEELVLNDYVSNSDQYIENIVLRLSEIDYNKSINNEEIIKKLHIIDGLYEDGLINATKETYYLPDNPCNKNICFSVRETYLFNFNFPLYEG